MQIDPKLKEDLKNYLLQKLKKKEKPKVIIRAPYELGDNELKDLKSKLDILQNSDIELIKDPSIMAGILIEFGSNVIDLSLNQELQTLAHTLYETV